MTREIVRIEQLHTVQYDSKVQPCTCVVGQSHSGNERPGIGRSGIRIEMMGILSEMQASKSIGEIQRDDCWDREVSMILLVSLLLHTYQACGV